MATEAKLKLNYDRETSTNNYFQTGIGDLSYKITTTDNSRSPDTSFQLKFDDYHLFWTHNDRFTSSRDVKEIDSKEIADIIWNEWLETVGIM